MTSAELRRFGPISILAILLVLAGNLLFVPLSALLVLLWARLSETPWREIGFVRPRSWLTTALVGIALGVSANAPNVITSFVRRFRRILGDEPRDRTPSGL